jgi:hypothetical protein
MENGTSERRFDKAVRDSRTIVSGIIGSFLFNAVAESCARNPHDYPGVVTGSICKPQISVKVC